ncbi:Atxe2 family lasso peptide isopeptidase [Caulobacter sp. Root343]|uniref:Atxe2 family lasso peptide isopeptidase n=1 Tax=Caulobacter sp. Root343 TaxID=1736520 RepID=UPI0006F3BFCD|nr:Atxe2 family lasso peptide isopeptidase [Caulobacter sp. Root343]KQV64045.1 hypothetical protein ASC70_19645 [Caulobacter sp. Root343]
MVTGLLIGLAIAASPPSPSPSPSLRDMVEMRVLSSVSVSSDERWVVYRQEDGSVAENRRRLSWWAAPTDGSRPARKIADGGAPIWTDAGPATPEIPQWTSDGRWFYFRAVTDNGAQLWRASPDDGQVEQVTRDAADIEAFIVGKTDIAWRVGPTRQAILEAERDEYDRGVRIDGAVDPSQNLFDAVDVNGRFAAQRLAGQWFARRSVLGPAPRFFNAALDGRSVEPLAAPDAKAKGLPAANVPPALFSGPPDVGATSPTGRLSIRRSRDGDATVEVLRPSGAEPIACQHRLCSGKIVAGMWRPGSDVVVLTRQEPGYRQALLTWDVAHGRFRELTGSQGLLGGGLTETAPCALTRSRAFCVVASPTTPPRLESIDLDTGGRTIVAAPNTGLRLGEDITPEPLAWTDADGHAFTGVFFPAQANGHDNRPPLFLTYYLCQGFVLGGTGDEWPLRALAASGIASLCVNKTGAPAEKQDSVANYNVALSGIRTIVGRLADAGRVDRTRIGMGGLSFGSEVAMWVATESDLLRAVSISTPQLEPAYYWIHGVAGRHNHEPLKIAWGLGDPAQTAERWKLVSPALKTDRIHAAVLMQMSEQEYGIGPELLARLSNSATPFEAYVFAHEPHIKIQPRHKLAVYQRNLDWFRFWLQGREDPDPAKTDQYARWEAMRVRADTAR